MEMKGKGEERTHPRGSRVSGGDAGSGGRGSARAGDGSDDGRDDAGEIAGLGGGVADGEEEGGARGGVHCDVWVVAIVLWDEADCKTDDALGSCFWIGCRGSREEKRREVQVQLGLYVSLADCNEMPSWRR